MPPVNFLLDFGSARRAVRVAPATSPTPSRLAAAAPPTSKVPSACWHSTPWWLNPRGGLDRLLDRVGRVGVPIAVAMERSAESLAVTRTCMGCSLCLTWGQSFSCGVTCPVSPAFTAPGQPQRGPLPSAPPFTPSQRPVAADRGFRPSPQSCRSASPHIAVDRIALACRPTRRFAVAGLPHLPHLQGAAARLDQPAHQPGGAAGRVLRPPRVAATASHVPRTPLARDIVDYLKVHDRQRHPTVWWSGWLTTACSG